MAVFGSFMDPAARFPPAALETVIRFALAFSALAAAFAFTTPDAAAQIGHASSARLTPALTPAQGCADSATALDRLTHVLPMFADTTYEAVEWRTAGGVAQSGWTDAAVVRDAELCVRIYQQARAWHNQAQDPSVFGDYRVHALRIGPYYAAVVDYPFPNSTGWSALMLLAPDDLRVLRVTLV